jgi:cytochrome c oxidase assembly protein subunit 11
MPVVFYIDPALVNDSDANDLDTITLSYTFYPQREPSRPVAETTTSKTDGKAAGRI